MSTTNLSSLASVVAIVVAGTVGFKTGETGKAERPEAARAPADVGRTETSAAIVAAPGDALLAAATAPSLASPPVPLAQNSAEVLAVEDNARVVRPRRPAGAASAKCRGRLAACIRHVD